MPTRRIKRTPRKHSTAAPRKEEVRKSEVTVRTSQISKDFSYPTLVIVLMAILLAFGLYLILHEPKESVNNAIALVATEDEVSYSGVEGKTALELLKENAQVETQSYEGIGELVVAINDRPSTSDHFWIFYINGEPAQVGAGAYETKPTDRLSWRFEAAN